jgi:pimeloyl-ACP methyl ester carboxylesterase
MDKSRILTLETETLQIAYERSGPSGGSPVVLLHGFPYDVRAYDEVAPPLQLERKRP